MTYRNFKNPVVVLALMICAVFPVLAQISTAEVTGGTVEGIVNDGITSFKGIPFAAPSVGDLRWMAPTPVQAQTGVKNANAFGPACMQNTGMAKQMGYSGNVSEGYRHTKTPPMDALLRLLGLCDQI